MPVKVKVHNEPSQVKINVNDSNSQVSTTGWATGSKKVKIHDSDSQVNAQIVSDKSQVEATSGCAISNKRLDLKIDKEIEDRKDADANLQEQIDDIVTKEGAKGIYVHDVDITTGSIDISLLNSNGQIISTDTIVNEALRPQFEPGIGYDGKVYIEKDDEYISTKTLNTTRGMLRSLSKTTQNTNDSQDDEWKLIPSNDDNWKLIPYENTQNNEDEWHLIPSTNSDWHLIPN